jgi:hypothetical protein
MTEPTPLFLNPEQLAAFLTERGFPMSVDRCREALVSGQLPGRKVGGRWITPMPMLQRWMEGLPMTGDPALLKALAAIERGDAPEPAKAIAVPFLARKSG